MSTDSPVTPKLLPPHYLAASVVAMIALYVGVGNTPLLPGYWRFGGSVPLLIGLAIAFRGSSQFAAVGTNIIPLTESTTLVTDGVFRWSRNPMYLGMVLFLAGLALLLNSVGPWGVVIGFAALVRIAFIAPEERLMQHTFGVAYSDYCSTTSRWLGSSGNFQSAPKANT